MIIYNIIKIFIQKLNYYSFNNPKILKLLNIYLNNCIFNDEYI